MENLEPQTIPTTTMLLTPEGYKAIQEELERLTVEKRQEIASRIRESKQHGEFSEDNNELDEVKFEQAMVEARISELKAIFSGAQVLDPSAISTEKVGTGAYITVEDVDRPNVSFEVRLVASIEADPDKDFISNESPMGLAISGRGVGDVVTFLAPAGKLRYRIAKIRA